MDPAGRSVDSRTTLVSGTNETLYRWGTRQYDPAGRVTREIRKLFTAPIAVAADGSIPTSGVTDVVVDSTYDANGNVLTVKDPLLRVSRNDYDTRGRLSKVTDPMGNNVVYTYDDANNKTTETVTEIPPVGLPQVFLTKYFYDAQNQLTKVTDPLNKDTLFQYDPRGNRTQTTDVELHVSSAKYDLLGHKTSETDANNGTTQYTYDLSGHLTSITDANNNQTTFTYDTDGRLKTEKRADTKTWTYGYDANGNRTTATDPNGTVVTTTYDADDRANARGIARGAGVLGPTSVTFGLDAIGRITSSAIVGDTAAAPQAFTYDSLNRVLTEQQQVAAGPNRTVAKGYDLASNLTALTYPSGLPLTYDLDALNRIAAVKQAGTAIVSYRDVGARPFDRTLANGIVQTWGYDTGRRLNDILSKKGATTVSQIAYTLSNLGNKTTISRPDLAKKATYTFNPNSWITQEALNLPIAGGTPERQTDYTADKVLNYSQIQERVNGAITATKTQTTNNRNQYPTFAGAALTYDPNGNLTGGAGIAGTALAYDYENRLKKATLSSGTVVENLFDAQGRKVRESTTVSGVTKTVDYVLHGDQVIEQYAGTTLASRYVKGRGIDETVRAELDVDANGSLETTVYPLQDELGNVERLTDGTGANLERYDYQGYGKPRIFDPTGTLRSTSSYGWKWLFQGREYQTTLLAYDFRARELWPDLGRFGQEDPAASRRRLATSQALLGAWSQYSDARGLYEIDVHYYAMYYLSRFAGFATGSARQIAWASQYVDNSNLGTPGFDWFGPGTRNNAFKPGNKRLRLLHFAAVDGAPVEENSDFSRAGVRLAARSKQFARLGIALHTYADSFSHAGFMIDWDDKNRRDGTWRPNRGHADTGYGGHAPDKPFLDVPKALRMASGSFELLKEAFTTITGGQSPPADHRQMRNDLTSMFSYREDDENLRSARWIGLLQVRFNYDITPYSPSAAPFSSAVFSRPG